MDDVPSPARGADTASCIWGRRLLILACLLGMTGFILPWWSSERAWSWLGKPDWSSGWTLVFSDGTLGLLVIPVMFSGLFFVALYMRRLDAIATVRLARIPLTLGSAFTALAILALGAGDKIAGMLSIRVLVHIHLGLGAWVTCLAGFLVVVAGWLLVGGGLRRR
jgi:hypothetical protein